MTITLSGNPVSTNHVWKHACRGGRLQSYLTPEGRALKESYQWEAKAQYRGAPLSGPLTVAIVLYFPDKRRRDIDNYSKVLFDALTGIVWLDDSQIEEAAVRKAIDRERPRIEITITKGKGGL